VMRSDLSAVILESPYVDFRNATLSHADNLAVPGRLFQRTALWFCQQIARIRFSAVRPPDLIPKIACPLMVIQSTDDPFVPESDQKIVAAATNSRTNARTRFWQIPGCFHIMGMIEQPDEFRRQFVEFLDVALETSKPWPELIRP